MWPLLVTTRIGNDLSWLAVKISVPSPVEYSPATHGTVTPSTLTVVFPQLPSICHTHKQTRSPCRTIKQTTSRPAWLSPAYLRHAHNRCLSYITGPFPNTAGHHHSRATQVSLTLPLTRSPAAASHTTGSSPRTPIQSGGLYGGAVTRGSISRTHCHAPPESGLFLGRKAPYSSFIPNPSAACPTGVGPSEPCIKTGARWAGQAEGTSSLVSIYCIAILGETRRESL